MTLSSTETDFIYTGNGSATMFAAGPYAQIKSQITVVLRNIAADTDVELVQGVHYDVSNLKNSAGVTITYPLSGDPLPATHQLLVYRSMDFLQSTEILNEGGFNARAIERTFDRTVMLVQELRSTIARMPVWKRFSAVVDFIMPEPEAGKVLKWNDAGTAIVNGPTLMSLVTAPDATYPSVAAMIASESLVVGYYVETLGYHNPGDGGGTRYKIVAAGTGTEDGGEFHNLTGIVGQAQMIERGPVNPMMFGAQGDGVTDDWSNVNAAIQYIIRHSHDVIFIEDVRRTYGGRIALEGGDGGQVYAVSAPFRSVGQEFAHMIVRNINFKAIGDWDADWDEETIAATYSTLAALKAATGRTVGEYVRTTNTLSGDGRGEVWEIIADNAARGSDDVRVVQLTGTAVKAKRVDMAMFNFNEVSAYVDFHFVHINCNDICGGIKLQPRCRAIGCWLEYVHHAGIICAGSDTWVDRCIISQWTQNDPAYYDNTRYTGVGILFEESDARVTSCTVRWMHSLMDVESTNNIISHCHMFNGMPSYMYGDGRSAARNEGIDEYFGWTPGTAATTNMPRRTSHYGIRQGFAGGLNGHAIDYDNLYFDNCHHEMYTDGATFTNLKLADKSTASPLAAASLGGNTEYGDAPTRNYWFRLHAYTANATPQFIIRGFTSMVTGAYKQLITYVDNGANTWAHDYANFVADQEANITQRISGTNSIQAMNGFHITPTYYHVYPSHNGDPAVRYWGLGGNAKLGFRHEETDAWSEIRLTGSGGADSFDIRPRGTTRLSITPTRVLARLVDLVVETFTDTNMKILADRAATSNLTFGDQDDDDVGLISYDHATDKFTIKTAATARMELDANGPSISGGKMNLNGNTVGGEAKTINDDAAGSFIPPRNGGFALITCGGTSDSPRQGDTVLIFYDVGTSLAIEKCPAWITLGTNVDVVTTDVAGTTGTDTKTTIAVQTGVVKIENRTGGNRNYQVSWL